MNGTPILKQIYDCLKNDGFDVYFPAQHKGDCKSPYVVIKDGGTIEVANISSERTLFVFMCYVPVDQYSKLEPYVWDVKYSLRGIYPLIMYAGNETESYYDDDVKGHMVSFQYQGARRLKNFKE